MVFLNAGVSTPGLYSEIPDTAVEAMYRVNLL
jgi:hypothetical protein